MEKQSIKAWALINYRRQSEGRSELLQYSENRRGFYCIYKTKKMAYEDKCFKDDKVVPVEIKILK